MILRKTSNNNKIIEVQSLAFIKEFLKNSNETFTIFDKDNDFEEIILKHKNMLKFYKEFLNFYEKNKKRFQIFGVDKIRFFNIDIANIDCLKNVCKDLWNNPENYLSEDLFKRKPYGEYFVLVFDEEDLDPEDDKNEEYFKDWDYWYDFLKYIWVKNSNDVEYRLSDLIDDESLFDKLEKS